MKKIILVLFTLTVSQFAVASWMGEIDLMVREEIKAYLSKSENLEIDMYKDIGQLSYVKPSDPRCDIEVAAYVKSTIQDQCNVCFSVEKNSAGETTKITPELVYCVE